MDPTLYMSKELNIYSQDGTKRLHVKENASAAAFVFDYKDAQNVSSPISVLNQHIELGGYFLPLDLVLSDIKQSVVDEASTRGDADHTLQDTINEHYQEHVTAIDGVNQSVGSYVTSLSGSISEVSQAVFYVRNDLENADASLGVRIDGEIADRQQALADVSQAISDETSARVIADTNILQSLTDEIGARNTAIETVQTSVVNEAKLRASADTTLQGQIITLLSGATSSTTEYKQLVTDEKKRAMDKEALLDIAVADAKAEAEVAMTNEAKFRLDEDVKLTASVVAEAKLAREEEVKLGARIDFLTHNTNPSALDSLSEIVAQFSTNGQGYADRLTYLEGVVMALVNR